MEIFWIMGAFFLIVTMIFIVIAIFLPEWVGITGNKAKEIMSHQQGSNEDTQKQSMDQEKP